MSSTAVPLLCEDDTWFSTRVKLMNITLETADATLNSEDGTAFRFHSKYLAAACQHYAELAKETGVRVFLCKKANIITTN